MTGIRLILAWAVVALNVSTLTGLAVRRRLGSCWSFTLYLLAVLVGDLLILLAPDRFWRKPFWVVKEGVCDLLSLFIAVEVAVATFRPFPTVARRALEACLVVGFITLASILSSHDQSQPFLDWTMGRAYPRLMNGIVAIFAIISVLVAWYQVPVRALHRAILLGLGPYLFVFTTLLSLLDAYGRGMASSINHIDPVAFLLLLIYWNYAAWRQGRPQITIRRAP
jgi:hypothetical protein